MISPVYCFLVFLFLSSSALAESHKPDSLPRDLAQWINRMTDCDHWGSEEPYNEKRAAEIKSAVDRLKCNNLEGDEKKLREKYKAKPEILKKFDRAIADAREIVS